jgi:diguanylate cyclase (GGDEF)-like protein
MLPLSAGYAFGFVALGPAIAIGATVLAMNAALFAVFRTGLNLRLRDPSLTKIQLYVGISVLMFALYHLEAVRGLSLSLCFLVFLFGVFRLNTREFLTLTLYTLAAYALVVNLLMHFRPQSVPSVRQEWLNWLLLAASLPWFGVVGGRMSALRERLAARNQELREAVATIHAMATRDEVTGLCNRAFFIESLRHALAQAERHDRSLALLFIDADRFKTINDSLGHAAGDRVLREIGSRIAGCVRASDIVARLGGDEFVVLIEDFGSRDAVCELAEKIVLAVSRPCEVEGDALALSVSVGVAIAPQDGADRHQLMRNADIAMYRAKAQGRNGYRFYGLQTDRSAA